MSNIVEVQAEQLGRSQFTGFVEWDDHRLDGKYRMILFQYLLEGYSVFCCFGDSVHGWQFTIYFC